MLLTKDKTLSVSAIKEGVVIDHIPAGQALKIMSFLRYKHSTQQITLGLNLTSQRLKTKDIIKIENYHLNNDEIAKLSIFAPKATINIINHFLVNKKMTCQIPTIAKDIFICPNKHCISRHENQSFFHLETTMQHILFLCHYCEKQFKTDQLTEMFLCYN